MKARIFLSIAAVVLAGALMWQCGEGVTDNSGGGDMGGGQGNDTGGGEEKDAGTKDGGGGRDIGYLDSQDNCDTAGGCKDAGKDGGGDGAIEEDAAHVDETFDGAVDDTGPADGGCTGWIECVEDLGGGCCGDVAFDPVCDNGVLKCPPGKIESSACVGIGPGCVSSDGGNDGAVEDGGDAGTLCEVGGGYCVFFQDKCKVGFHDGAGLGCPGGRSGKCCVPGEPPDAGQQDTGSGDGGAVDGGATDGGKVDGGAADGGGADAGGGVCSPGDTKEYACPDGHTVPWCVCTPGACQPECRAIGSFSEGWYDPCSGQLILYAQCAKCASECQQIGSKSEGWYDTCGDYLLLYAQCAPSWSCKDHPETQCVTQVPCTTNCDCPIDRPLCRSSYCENPPIANCATDRDCACGMLCQAGICKAGTTACGNACDCAKGEICVNDVCKAKIGSNCSAEPCPCGQHCIDQGPMAVCVQGCQTNCDCPDASPICIGGVCGVLPGSGCGSDNRNCPCGQVCVKNVCEKAVSPCNTNCDCTDPKSPICANGSCAAQPPACSIDTDCPCGKRCGGISGCVDIQPPCQTSCDCGIKQICSSGVCADQTSTRCLTDNDCLCGQTCGSLGSCQAGGQPCQRSCDCPQGLICANNKCVAMPPNQVCVTDAECPCQSYCTAGMCAFGCNDGCDCPANAPFCVKQRCAPAASGICRADADCKCGEVCNGGTCQPAAGVCKTSCDCPQGGAISYACKGNMCVQYTIDFCLYQNDCPCLYSCTNNKCVRN